jgi:hypothetical protein
MNEHSPSTVPYLEPVEWPVDLQVAKYPFRLFDQRFVRAGRQEFKVREMVVANEKAMQGPPP